VSTEQTADAPESLAQVAVESVPEAPIAPSETVIPPPEPVSNPEPFWTSRRYIKRAFGFMWHGTFIEGSFYEMDKGQVNADGLYGTTEYQTIDDLVRLSGGTSVQQQALVSKLQSLLRQP
jgi:hypothetical protein